MRDGRIARPNGDFSSSTGKVLERRFDLSPVPPARKPFEEAEAAYRAMSSQYRQMLGDFVTSAFRASRPVPERLGPNDELLPATGVMSTEEIRDLAEAALGFRPTSNEVKEALLTAGHKPTISTPKNAPVWRFAVEYVGA